ncbi:hypothetical protein [Micromonospora sp. RTP1Z1]|nr:hypothetical protein [Micromonospora sp. RTP1Z1]
MTVHLSAYSWMEGVAAPARRGRAGHPAPPPQLHSAVRQQGNSTTSDPHE